MKSGHSISELFKKYRSELSYIAPPQLKREIFDDLVLPQKSGLAWFSFGGGALVASLALIMAFEAGRFSSNSANDSILIQEVVSSHVRSLMVSHLSDVVSSDQHTVKPWFEGKLDFAPRVKDFSSEAFPLVGGRMDYISGRPTAALVYKFNQHVINVFQYPSATSESTNPRLQNFRGYQIFSWNKDGMNEWVVSDLNAADLQKFVDLLSR